MFYCLFSLYNPEMNHISSYFIQEIDIEPETFQSITAGSHRLWTHRSYKASFPLRVFLMLTNCIAMEDSIYVWARDHRVHHKFSETPADPHDATRGFFFAHVSLNVE